MHEAAAVGQKIILGLELDGEVFRELPPGGAEQGVAAVGPEGLLSVLETALGLPGAPAPQALRILRYERALAELAERGRPAGKAGRGAPPFYLDSFRLDPFAAARVLLAARDELLMGMPAAGELGGLKECGPRVAALVAAEALLEPAGSVPGLPDRLRAVVARLGGGFFPNPIASLTLAEPEACWAPLYVELFGLLRARGTEVRSLGVPAPAAQGGDLHTALVALAAQPGQGPAGAAGGQEGRGGRPPNGDGSLVLLQAAHPVEAAEAAAACLELFQRREAGLPFAGSVVVIDQLEAGLMDATLGRAGLPAGGHSRDAWGIEPLQLLSHYVNLLWEPVHPESMLQYLLLTVSPLRSSLRRSLVRLLKELPGTGGAQWKQTIRSWLEEAGGSQELPRLVERWLEPRPVSRDGLLEADRVTQACRDLAAWARSRAHADPGLAEPLTAAAAQAELLERACRLRGGAFSRVELQRLLGDLAPAVPRRRTRELGAAATVRSPGALLSPASTLLWVGASEAAVPPSAASFFTLQERNALAGCAVRLPEPERELERLELAWRRAALLTTHRLVLIYAEHCGEESDHPHPLWYQLLQGFPAEPPPENRLTVTAGKLLAGRGGPPWWEEGLVQTASASAGAAAFRPRWRLPQGIAMREVESPSSLERLLGCPLAYTLRYRAGVRDREDYLLPEGELLLGSLAHRVLGSFVDGAASIIQDLEAERIEREVRRRFCQAVSGEASLLSQPGKDRELAVVAQAVIAAAHRLVQLLRQGGFTIEGVELPFQTETEAGPLQGRTDLLLRAPGGGRAVLDMKWSGTAYRLRLLREGKAVQLAAYSRAASPGWPATGYLIITTTRLLTVTPGVFPEAAAAAGPSDREVWEAAAAEVALRRRELAEGIVAVGTPEELWRKDSEGFFLSAPCRFCSYQQFCRIADKKPSHEEAREERGQ